MLNMPKKAKGAGRKRSAGRLTGSFAECFAGRFVGTKTACMQMIAVKSIAYMLFIAVAMIVAMAFTRFAYAASDDFDTKEFNVAMKVAENHVVEVEETIKVDFNRSGHHGITRYIPYKSKYYDVSDIDSNRNVDEVTTQTRTESSGKKYKLKCIRIGDPDELLTGEQTFKVKYRLRCYKDDDANKDFFSHNVFPPAWATPVDVAKITIKMPKTVDWDGIKFFGGSYGSKEDISTHFTRTLDSAGNTITLSGRNIPAYWGVTVDLDLPEGYWVNPTDRSGYGKVLIVFLIAVPLLLGLIWFLAGRDPKLVKPVEFYPPEGLTPVELGYVIDGSVDNKDLSAMIFYYASKGCLKIRQKEDESLELVKLRDPDPSEKLFSQQMFASLFGRGDVVDPNELPDDFATDLEAVKESVRDYYENDERKLFTTASRIARAFGLIATVALGVVAVLLIQLESGEDGNRYMLIAEAAVQFIGIQCVISAFDASESTRRIASIAKYIIGAILMVAGVAIPAFCAYYYLKGIAIIPPIFVSVALSYVFTMLMKARTKESAGLQGRILGFKNFIRNAEYKKLKALSDDDPEYFFNIIPYAYVMGMSTAWAKKFDNIAVENPGWYDGYSGFDPLTPLLYCSMINSFGSSVSTEIDASGLGSDSDFGGFGGGGFGGGGFSGGGFGGGGGGAW